MGTESEEAASRKTPEERRGEATPIDPPPPAPPRPLPPFAIARNEKRPSSLRLPSPPLEIEDVGKSRKRKTLNAFENIMNPLESLDVTEEPGFPDLSTTPRSIRNMENLLVTIDKQAAEASSPRTSGTHSPLGSPRDLGSPSASPRKAKSMTGRDVWHLGKGTAGPRSYGSFSKVSRDKWDSSKPGGETVWNQILKSNKANNKEGTKV